MKKAYLTLIPFKKNAFKIELFENNVNFVNVDDLLQHSNKEVCVFSDISYEFFLDYENETNVKDVNVYINDEYEQSIYKNGRIYFPSNSASGKRIFLECYGFVEICIKLILNDGRVIYFYTEYLPVLVQKNELNNSIKSMINYLYSHQDLFLFNGISKSKNIADFKENKYRDFETQIILAEQIAEIYEQSYGYFKANSRFCIEKVPLINNFEKLQFILPATLKYIVSHPEELKKVNSINGVRINNSTYQPQKTLSLQNVNSYDIYENKIIVGFLFKVIEDITKQKEECNKLLKDIPSNELYSNDYVYSSYFMFCETKRILERRIERLSYLRNRFTRLYELYNNILPIKTDRVSIIPKPTPIFLFEPQYNKIFLQIYKWFKFGMYDFSKEKFMLSFLKISSLYESYLLAKLIVYFKERGYNLVEAKHCIYPVSKKQKYKNTNIDNTFTFSNTQRDIILYYQPVIFDTDQSAVNLIGLYRNNSISIYSNLDNENIVTGHYYVPDYLIKINDKNGIKYLIIDAKFSSKEQVRKNYVKDLAFKYLFSITPINNNEIFRGICIIYGKCTENDKMVSVYDNKIGKDEIYPLFEILPLIENINTDKHSTQLDILLEKVLN